MKYTKSIMLTLALITSIPSFALWPGKQQITIACLLGVFSRLHLKKSYTQDELDRKRSIMDEKSPVDACIRLFDEELIGQYADDKHDKPATGLGWACKMIKENVLPITGVLLVMEDTQSKITKGLKSLGLDFLVNWVPVIQTNSTGNK